MNRVSTVRPLREYLPEPIHGLIGIALGEGLQPDDAIVAYLTQGLGDLWEVDLAGTQLKACWNIRHVDVAVG